jgi:hypothetical protein
MAIPALAIIAASALLKHQADRQALRRQESIRRSMEAYQRARARETEAATEELLKKQTPQARAEELKKLTGERESSLRETVAATAPPASRIAGAVSQDYERAQEAQANTVAERTRRAIEQLAAMGAPGEQRLKFGTRFGRAAGQVDAANRASENVGNAFLRDIEGVRPNPWMSLAGEVGMGVGSGLLGAPWAAAPNNGQGWEDASGNLYDPNTRPRVRKAFGLWGL